MFHHINSDESRVFRSLTSILGIAITVRILMCEVADLPPLITIKINVVKY